MESPILTDDLPEDLMETRALLCAYFPEIFRGKQLKLLRGKARADILGNEILISFPEIPTQVEFFWLLERAGRKIARQRWGESCFFIGRVARLAEGTLYEKCPF